MSQLFAKSAIDRLKKFLQKNHQTESIERLTPDASTREYFRVQWNDKNVIACVYPEKFDDNLPYLDVTNLFKQADLPVAEIINVDFESGIILHQDFGDKILRDILENSNKNDRDALLNKAISLIAQIQKTTNLAFKLNSISSFLKFDKEKLLWELEFFKTHFFESFKKVSLSDSDSKEISKEFSELAEELENLAIFLTHRDFHSANLMLDQENNIQIIDHQDARLGSVAYDLVSLLLDRITELPSAEWLDSKKEYFLAEREKLGLDNIDKEKFNYEFDLMTIQRCLKAIGTFSNQASNFGKTQYIQFIDPMFKVVLEACERLQRFPNLQRIITNILFIESK